MGWSACVRLVRTAPVELLGPVLCCPLFVALVYMLHRARITRQTQIGVLVIAVLNASWMMWLRGVKYRALGVAAFHHAAWVDLAAAMWTQDLRWLDIITAVAIADTAVQRIHAAYAQCAHRCSQTQPGQTSGGSIAARWAAVSLSRAVLSSVRLSCALLWLNFSVGCEVAAPLLLLTSADHDDTDDDANTTGEAEAEADAAAGGVGQVQIRSSKQIESALSTLLSPHSPRVYRLLTLARHPCLRFVFAALSLVFASVDCSRIYPQWFLLADSPHCWLEDNGRAGVEASDVSANHVFAVFLYYFTFNAWMLPNVRRRFEGRGAKHAGAGRGIAVVIALISFHHVAIAAMVAGVVVTWCDWRWRKPAAAVAPIVPAASTAIRQDAQDAAAGRSTPRSPRAAVGATSTPTGSHLPEVPAASSSPAAAVVGVAARDPVVQLVQLLLPWLLGVALASSLLSWLLSLTSMTQQLTCMLVSGGIGAWLWCRSRVQPRSAHRDASSVVAAAADDNDPIPRFCAEHALSFPLPCASVLRPLLLFAFLLIVVRLPCDPHSSVLLWQLRGLVVRPFEDALPTVQVALTICLPVLAAVSIIVATCRRHPSGSTDSTPQHAQRNPPARGRPSSFASCCSLMLLLLLLTFSVPASLRSWRLQTVQSNSCSTPLGTEDHSLRLTPTEVRELQETIRAASQQRPATNSDSGPHGVGSSRVARTQHDKSHACLEAHLELEPFVPSKFAHGVFSSAGQTMRPTRTGDETNRRQDSMLLTSSSTEDGDESDASAVPPSSPIRRRVLLRFSQGGFRAESDTSPNVRGLSVRIEGASALRSSPSDWLLSESERAALRQSVGAEVAAASEDAQDFLFVTTPFFFASAGRDIAPLMRLLGRTGAAATAKDFLRFLMPTWHDPSTWRFHIFVSAARMLWTGGFHTNLLRAQWFTPAPARLGPAPSAVKYRLTPVTCATASESDADAGAAAELESRWAAADAEIDRLNSVDARSGVRSSFLRHGVSRRLSPSIGAGWSSCFAWEVQEQGTCLNRLEDAETPWEGAWHTLGTLTIPAQEVPLTEDSPHEQARCTIQAFNPWNGIRAHAPLGSISAARRVAYVEAAKVRAEAAAAAAKAVRDAQNDDNLDTDPSHAVALQTSTSFGSAHSLVSTTDDASTGALGIDLFRHGVMSSCLLSPFLRATAMQSASARLADTTLSQYRYAQYDRPWHTLPAKIFDTPAHERYDLSEWAEIGRITAHAYLATSASQLTPARLERIDSLDQFAEWYEPAGSGGGSAWLWPHSFLTPSFAPPRQRLAQRYTDDRLLVDTFLFTMVPTLIRRVPPPSAAGENGGDDGELQLPPALLANLTPLRRRLIASELSRTGTDQHATSLAELAAQGRLHLVDLESMIGLHTHTDAVLYAPIALFYADFATAQLRPLLIQMTRNAATDATADHEQATSAPAPTPDVCTSQDQCPSQLNPLSSDAACPASTESACAATPASESVTALVSPSSPSSHAWPAPLPRRASDRWYLPHHTSPWTWHFAKMHLLQTAGNYGQCVSHLLETHLQLEPIAIALHRHVPASHPLHALVAPFLRGLFAVNDFGRSTLLHPTRSDLEITALGMRGSLELMARIEAATARTQEGSDQADAGAPQPFARRAFPDEMRRRGYDEYATAADREEAELGGDSEAEFDVDAEAQVLSADDDDARSGPARVARYLYGEYGVLYWRCLRTYVRASLRDESAYGPASPDADARVRSDRLVQSWLSEASHVEVSGASLAGLGASASSLASLERLLTHLLFTATFGHAASSAGQYDLFSFTPFAPLRLRRPMPLATRDAESAWDQRDIVAALGSYDELRKTTLLASILSRPTRPSDDLCRGYCAQPEAEMCDPAQRRSVPVTVGSTHARQWIRSLQRLQCRLMRQQRVTGVDWPMLMPSHVAASVHA